LKDVRGEIPATSPAHLLGLRRRQVGLGEWQWATISSARWWLWLQLLSQMWFLAVTDPLFAGGWYAGESVFLLCLAGLAVFLHSYPSGFHQHSHLGQNRIALFIPGDIDQSSNDSSRREMNYKGLGILFWREG